MGHPARTKACARFLFTHRMLRFFPMVVLALCLGGLEPHLASRLFWPLWLTGCTSSQPEVAGAGPLSCEDCNLVVISLTGLRKAHMGSYGSGRDTTPQLDRFFSPAIRFEETLAPSPWTLPVAASLFSSSFPYTHGVMDRYGKRALADDAVTLAEVLQERGFQTAAFTGGGEYNRSFNLHQGFDLYVDEQNFDDFGAGMHAGLSGYLGLSKLVPAAVRWLETHGQKRFFLYLQGYDIHCPYKPTPPFDTRFASGPVGAEASQQDFSQCFFTFERQEPVEKDGQRGWNVLRWKGKEGIEKIFLSEADRERLISLYDGQVAQTDQALAPLLEGFRRLGLEKNTLFVFLAEHGELLGEHGRFMRGGLLSGTFYEPAVSFPLLMRHPRVKEARDINALAQTVDLAPTLLQLLRVAVPVKAAWQGQSLVPALLEAWGAPAAPPVTAPGNATAGAQETPLAFAGSQFTGCNPPYYQGISQVEVARDARFKLIREAILDVQSGITRTQQVELFDLKADPGETRNLALERPQDVARLKTALGLRFPDRPPPVVPLECQGEAASALPGTPAPKAGP